MSTARLAAWLAFALAGAPRAAADEAPADPPPRLRGVTIERRDELHPVRPGVIGLEQSEQPYRADLPIARSALASGAPIDAAALRERQLAIHSGRRVESLPDAAVAILARAPAPAPAAPRTAPPARGWPLWLIGAAGALAGAAAVGLLRRRALTARVPPAARDRAR